jgi:hypothetical protein
MEKHGFRLYNGDERDRDPNRNAHRKAEFRKGWQKAAKGESLSSGKLDKALTWYNLGYRLGELLGPTPPELIERMYDLCVEQQKSAQ